MNCVDGVTWNWPKPLLVGGKSLLTDGQHDLRGGGTFYQGDSDGCRFLSLSLSIPTVPLVYVFYLYYFSLFFFSKLIVLDVTRHFVSSSGIWALSLDTIRLRKLKFNFRGIFFERAKIAQSPWPTGEFQLLASSTTNSDIQATFKQHKELERRVIAAY